MEARPWRDGKTVTYRYHPFDGPPISLGTDLDAAIRTVLDMIGKRPGHGTLRWVWEQWTKSRKWERYAEGTRVDYALAWAQLDARFGHMQAGTITAPMVARYVHVERAGSPRRADVERSVLSNLLKHGIMLGVAQANVTVGVEPHGSTPSDVMPETFALRALTKWLAAQPSRQRRLLGMAVEFAAATGARQAEFLPLTWFEVDDNEVRTVRAKQRGRRQGRVRDIIDIGPELRGVLARLRALVPDGPLLFPTEDGNQYTAKGWKTLWQRAVADAIEAKVIAPGQRFNFHALRRWYNTTHRGLHGKNANLHANPAVTSRVYDATLDEHRKAL